MRTLLASLAFAAVCCAPVHAADGAHEADVAAIRQVVQQFQAALQSHDGKTLGSLFLQDHDSWLSVLDDASYAEAKARNPAVRKVTRSTWQQFANFVQTAPKPVEERFYNVRIDTNGAVGSVYFDFDFLVDGKVGNRGSETWQMVRAEDGWKISSMLYSNGR